MGLEPNAAKVVYREKLGRMEDPLLVVLLVLLLLLQSLLLIALWPMGSMSQSPRLAQRMGLGKLEVLHLQGIESMEPTLL